LQPQSPDYTVKLLMQVRQVVKLVQVEQREGQAVQVEVGYAVVLKKPDELQVAHRVGVGITFV
jgi:hypothetical protein